MPYSYPEFKNEVITHIKNTLTKGSRILDVGPGAGIYADLLNDNGYHIDCIEIWEPYVSQFNLNEKYENVYIGDITNFDISNYDYIIMGDVLEHLTVENATNLMRNINFMSKKCMVAVPYLFNQGEYEGNKYETHEQPDLTPDIVKNRYPDLRLLHGNNIYGYYINYTRNDMTLTEIANYHTVDKGTLHYEAHGYTDIYSNYITSTVENHSLLEIGVWHGDSIRMWNDYNPNLNVTAIDIDLSVKDFLNGSEKFNLYIGDQSDTNFLEHVFQNSPDFDFVIDDGSHNYKDILASFLFIYPKLKHGAIYFIEDLHAGHAEKDRLIASLFETFSKLNLKCSNANFFCDGKLLMFVK